MYWEYVSEYNAKFCKLINWYTRKHCKTEFQRENESYFITVEEKIVYPYNINIII